MIAVFVERTHVKGQTQARRMPCEEGVVLLQAKKLPEAVEET